MRLNALLPLKETLSITYTTNMKQQLFPLIFLHGVTLTYAFYATLRCEAFAIFDILGLYVMWGMFEQKRTLVRLVNEMLGAQSLPDERSWMFMIHVFMWFGAQCRDGNLGIVRAARLLSSVSMGAVVMEIEQFVMLLPPFQLKKSKDYLPGKFREYMENENEIQHGE